MRYAATVSITHGTTLNNFNKENLNLVGTKENLNLVGTKENLNLVGTAACPCPQAYGMVALQPRRDSGLPLSASLRDGSTPTS